MRLTISFSATKVGCMWENRLGSWSRKKNPLILPPDYSRLPDPKPSPKILNSTNSDDIKKLLSLDDESDDFVIDNNDSIEEFVLKNIKKNWC